MNKLTVVNRMIGTMGEKPLNSLTDAHARLPACLSALDTASKRIQAMGWWFNTETPTLTPSPVDDAIYLPGDTLEVVSPESTYVQRGNRLYDLSLGSFVFTKPIKITLRRLLAFEDLPQVAADYIASSAIKQFQLDYDGDSVKARELEVEVERARVEMNRTNTRNSRTNLLLNNPRLAALKIHWPMRRYS